MLKAMKEEKTTSGVFVSRNRPITDEVNRQLLLIQKTVTCLTSRHPPPLRLIEY